MNEKNIRIFQIFYNEETRALLDPAFIPLDNSDNPRPDWSEYWPIRKLAERNTFTDEDYVGVFSPRFREKTGLTGSQVLERIRAADDQSVFSFSPHFEQMALHRNPFEQGERKHPGLTVATEATLLALHIDLDIRNLISDQRTTIFANYFVARYPVWKAWMDLVERVFQICEAGDSELAKLLNHATIHRATDTPYPMKVFVLERLITIVLHHLRTDANYCYDFGPHNSSPGGNTSVYSWLLICDALKGQYRNTGNQQFLDAFLQVQNQLLTQLGIKLVSPGQPASSK